MRILCRKAGHNPRWEGYTVAHAKAMCGSFTKGDPRVEAVRPAPRKYTNVDVPASFDARSAWPACADVIGHIRDQSGCGSCWAFGSTEALNDRKCIQSGGKFKTELSAQDTTSCCNLLNGCFGSQACDGGIPSEAWSYFVNSGVVSGGDYNTIGKGESCWPYQLPICAHHVTEPGLKPCQDGLTAPSCPNPRKCSEPKYTTSWDNDRHSASTSYSLNSVQDIESDLAQYGSVTAAFSVYEDFLTYKSGVYQHESGNYLGGHAIKILGWGVENGLDYWLVANSWNDGWGDKGYFKIRKGVNECGIEDDVCAGQA